MYIDNELPEQSNLSVETHLAECKQCTNTLNEFSRLKELIGKTTPYSANPFLWTRVAEDIKEGLPIPVGILVPRFLKAWIPIATIFILFSGFILFKLPEPQKIQYKTPLTMETAIFNIPLKPENMERITLNLLVYTNGITGEVQHAKF